MGKKTKRKLPVKRTDYVRIGVILCIIWTVVISCFMWWEFVHETRLVEQQSRIEAIASFNKDLVYRRWSAEHGGTYVPVTPGTLPNPYLSHIPERDITTPSGKKLTLVNPAYMTRQVYELGDKQYGVKGHITSLNPIRKENAPDAWERSALEAFKTGAHEISSIEIINESRYMRLMRPLVTEKRCLKCHGVQGYKEGELRGGISVSVPMRHYETIINETIGKLALIHSLILIIGLAGLISGIILLKKRSEEQLVADLALLDSERRLSEAQHVARVAHFERNISTDVCHWTDELFLLFGFEPEEGVNTPDQFKDHLYPGDREHIFSLFEKSVITGEGFEADTRYITESGETRYAHIIAHVIPGTNGKAESIRGTFQDITERKLAEEALKISEVRHRKLFDEALDGIALVDAESGLLIDCNKALADLVEKTKEDLKGQPESILHPHRLAENSDPETGTGFIDRAVNQTVPIREKIITSEGEIKDVEIRASTIQLNNKNCYLGIYRDLSAQLQMETRLQQAQKLEAIGTLAGGIAHDFNNILYPMVGFAEMLKDDLPETSPLHEHVNEILIAALRSRDLVKQILTFSRQTDEELKPVKLQPVLKESIRLLRSSIPKTISFNTSIDPDCRPVVADPTRIHQIAMNLATNAYHAMEETGGRISFNLHQVTIDMDHSEYLSLKPGDYACFSVTDTGTGIPPEIREKMFDPYFTTKEVSKGTGLGLSVVQGIVKRSGGEIHIYSEPGKGTDIRVYLPVIHSSENEAPEITEPLQRGNEHILLVDDEVTIAAMLTQMLKRLGYTITSCTSSTEALSRFLESPDSYDGLVTDMTMPAMTGVDLAKEIKKIRPAFPVVICTGFSDRLNDEACQEIGIDGYITKPVVRKDLASAIRKAIDTSVAT